MELSPEYSEFHPDDSSSSDDEMEVSVLSSSSICSTTNTSFYTSSKIKELLSSGKTTYSILKNDSKRTLPPWWRSFGYPAVLNGKHYERIIGYISCVKCFQTFHYGPSSGTKRFLSHADRCSPLDSTNASNSNVDDSTLTQLTLNQTGFTKRVKVLQHEQNELKQLYAQWVCSDMRPFTIVEDEGFAKLAEAFIKIGSKYGSVNMKDVLKSRQTVSRTVDELAVKYRSNLKNELTEPLEAQSVTIAPDFWSNKYNQQGFLGVNMTFTTHDYLFKSIDVFCIPFNGTKSYDIILETLRRHLSEYGVTDLSNINIISDRGANFVKAFAVYNPVYCFGHRLNNILKVCFFQQQSKDQSNQAATRNNCDAGVSFTANQEFVPSDSESDSSDVEENQELNEDMMVIFQKKRKTATATSGQTMSAADIPPEAKKILFSLKGAKNLVKYVKLTGLNQEIIAAGGATLHQACVVRWLSLSDLLESVIKSFKITRKLLFSKQKQHMINELNEQCLKQLVILLKPFKDMMTVIQRGNSSSLHLVALCYITLKDVLNSYECLKKYNKEHNNKEKDENAELTYDDEETEHELEGQHRQINLNREKILQILGIKWFCERLLFLLKNMFVLDVRHVVATLLHPSYRALKRFPDHIKSQCHNYARRQVRILRDKANSDERTQRCQSEPPTKKIKSGRSLFSRFESDNCDDDFLKHNESGTESDEFEYDIKRSDELDRYLIFEFDKTKEYLEPLEFWKHHQNQFPFLSKLARIIFSIPATTTNVEREFSKAGYILNQRRSSLKPDEVDKILFVRSIENVMNTHP